MALTDQPDATALRPVRVLQVVEAFGGGALEVVTNVAARLSARGCAMGIAYGTRPETPADVGEVVSGEVELFPMPWTERTLSAQIAAGRTLRKLVDGWQPEVVHLHSSFAGVVGTLALQGRVPLIYSPHAYSFTINSQGLARRTVYRTLERRVGRRSTLVAAVSEGEARLAREVVGARSVRTVPNGIPELDPGALPSPADRPRAKVVAMGRVGDQNQPAASARILASVRDLADVLWLGGPSTGSAGARALKDAGIEITGWLSRDAAMRQLSEATAYLHWTAWDGQPLSVLEAMALDVVTVASDIEPNRELLGADQVCATEAEAVRLIRAALTDPARRDALLCDQRARREGYGADRMARQWHELYVEMAEASV